MAEPIAELGPAVFLDTECTGLDDDREVIEAAYIRPARPREIVGGSDRIPLPITDGSFQNFEQRYKPEGEITFGAMAVHHILPADLDGCPPSGYFSLPEGIEYLVAHNVDFDWQAIGSPPGVKRIDTCSIARWVWQDCDSYSLGALIYRLLGPTPETREMLRHAHSAMADVMLSVRLLQCILEEKPEITTWSSLYAYSEACRIPRTMPIGEKQGLKGLTLDEAVDVDFGFVQWCLRQDWIDDYLRIGLEQAIERAEQQWQSAPAAHTGDCDDDPF